MEEIMKKVVILIPALDPPDIFISYIDQLVDAGFRDILVVDDGSSDKKIFDIIRSKGVVILEHEVNKGKGQALKTGMEYYKGHYDYQEYAGIITADSDGQHLCKDVKQLAEMLVEGSEKLLLGSRDFSLPHVPPKSRFGNNLTSFIFKNFLRIKINDTQTGLRGIPNVLIEECLQIPGQRFEYETSMLIEVGKKAGICEIPIETVYYEENKGTHFNPIVDSIKIYKTIFGTFFRYIFSALSSSILDYLLFLLFDKLVLASFANRIVYATYMARGGSSVYNFLMNKNIVFKNHNSYKTTAVKYFLLCIVQAFLSGFLVTQGHQVLHIDEIILKPVVDVCLFLVSYQIQRRFVFNEEKTK